MIRNKTILLFGFFLLAFSVQLHAQDFHVQVQHFSIDEGLSHREVHDVFQDSRGLIWISTLYGINRYDGHNFTWFTKEKNGLSSNNINKVLEDPQGWLWVFSAKEGSDVPFDYVDLINIQTLELLRWEKKNAPFQMAEIAKCVFNEHRELYFGLNNGDCWKLNLKGEFEAIKIDAVKNFTPYYCTGRGTIWGKELTAESSNLIEINQAGEILHKYELPFINDLAVAGEDSAGQLWFRILYEHQNASVYYIDQHWQQQSYDLTKTPIGDISDKIIYGQHQLYIHPKSHDFWWTGAETFSIATADGYVENAVNDKHPSLAFASSVFFDNQGRGWVGTIDGLFNIKFERSRFQNLLSLYTKDAELYGNRIECRGIWESPNGNVLINSYAGTFLLSPEGDVLVRNFLKVPEEEKWASMGLFGSSKGDAWFGWLKPVRLNGNTGELEFFHLPPEKVVMNNWVIQEQWSGRIWFAGLNGDFAYLEAGEKTLRLFENYKGFQELKSANILDIQQRKDGMFWLVSNTGLYLFDPEKLQILERYWTGGQGRVYIPHNNLHHLYQDGDSLLWLATGGGGLVKLPLSTSAPAQSSVEQFTKSEGLSSNVIYSLYPDDYGNLWMSSDYGLMQFNIKAKRSRTFLPTDGLPHFEFNRISHHLAKDGRLYFGSLNGVTTFNPRDFQIFESKNNAPLVLLGLEQYDGKQDKLVNKLPGFNEHPEIVLNPKDRVINLEFALLDYNAPERIRYAYRIEGVSEKWTHLRENKVSLSGLPYGEFLLKIKGQAATGVFSDQELAIPITVVKPLYLKTWFIVTVALILLVAGPVFFKIRTRQLENQKRQLELQVQQRTETILHQNEQLAIQAVELRQLDEVKSRFFANVSHELRTPLTLMLGPIGSVLKTNQLDNRNFTLLKKAQHSGKSLLRMINEILDLSKMESGRMMLDEKPVRPYKLLQRYFSQFESHARLQGLQLVFEYKAGEELQVLLDVEKFEKVVNNFLSNAIKFTSKSGRVTMSFQEMEGQLELRVADTGQGIHPDDVANVFDRFYQTNRPEAPAEGGTGIGLALVNEYAQLFGGKAWVESVLGKGSTFYFQFPKKMVAGAELEISEKEDEQIADEQIIALSKPAIKPTKADLPAVLVVEDNPELRDYLRIILEEKYQVITAGNGQVALEVLSHQPTSPNGGGDDGNTPSALEKIGVGLILSDIMMPVMDGYQLLENLKSDDRFRHIPVVMLTARADLRDKLKALRIGVDDYLLKPFEEEELLVRIENLLANSANRGTASAGVDEESIEPILSQADADWLFEIEQLAQDGLDKKLLSVNWLSAQANLSERQFRRRLKTVTGYSPLQYIAELRLQKARQLLEIGKYKTIAELAYAMGYNDAPAFSRSFRNQFGKSPSDYFHS